MKRIAFASVLAVSIGLAMCGRKAAEKTEAPYDIETLASLPFDADSLIPGDIESVGVRSAGDMKTTRADQVQSRLGAGAERYLTYHMVGIAVAEYTVKGNQIRVEIAQFADDSYAYGFYASLRPDGIPSRGLGSESYEAGLTTRFVKAEYVVSLSCKDDSEGAVSAREVIAREIDNRIGGRRMIPSFYILFPWGHKIAPSAKFHPYQFLDVAGLNRVYTTSYLFGKDTLVLFLTVDRSGQKFIRLREYAESIGRTVASPKGFDFDQGYSVAFSYPGRGIIVAGMKNGKLVGAVGYNPRDNKKLVTGWIKGLS